MIFALHGRGAGNGTSVISYCYHDRVAGEEVMFMPDVLVREVSPDVLEALKGRARQNGRSLQVELKTILEQAAYTQKADARAVAAKIRRSLAQTTHSDSVELLREDRRR
jgi:antitoxin FitA